MHRIFSAESKPTARTAAYMSVAVGVLASKVRPTRCDFSGLVFHWNGEFSWIINLGGS